MAAVAGTSGTQRNVHQYQNATHTSELSGQAATATPLEDVVLQEHEETSCKCWAAFKRCFSCCACHPEEQEDAAQMIGDARLRKSLLGLERSPTKGDCAIL